MAVFSYRTIQTTSQGLFKEKGSKFLAFAFPVATEADVNHHLAALRKEYFDARHHCYAYRLGPDKSKFRANDDGEPNHSAGDPILGQIRSHDLTDILIVVVRYFGGVKLGVGGLIAAYKAAADDAIAHARVVELEVMKRFQLTFDYASTSDVMRLVKQIDATIVERDFEDALSRLTIDVPMRNTQSMAEKLMLLQVKHPHVKMQ